MPATTSPASTTSTTSAARSSASPRPCVPAPPAGSRPRTATRATTSRTPRTGSKARPSCPTTSWPGAGVEIMLESIRGTLERFRVHMDRFNSEQALYDQGKVAAILDRLEEKQHVYPLDGAVWLRTTTFGDDKDRVLMRSDGEFTYFAGDIANHEEKHARGFDHLIDIWGADHHGYMTRVLAAWQAVGGEPGGLELRDHAARQPDRGRPASADVQAPGHDRRARRPDRRHRHRRHPLVPAPAQPRHHARPRPRAGPHAQPGQPGLLRAVRPRAHREHPAQGRRGAGRRPRWRRTSPRRASSCIRRRGRWSRNCSSCRTRFRSRRGGGRRTASLRIRRRLRRHFRRSTATARSSARPTRAATRTSESGSRELTRRTIALGSRPVGGCGSRRDVVTCCSLCV